MKRLLSFALTFLILCSLTIPTFAAETILKSRVHILN